MVGGTDWGRNLEVYICNCSLIIEKVSFNEWMTFAKKLTQSLWKNLWLQQLREKKNSN